MNDLSSTNLEDVAYALRRFSTLADMWMNHHDFRNIGTIMYAKIRGIEASLKNRMDPEGIRSTSLRKDKLNKTVRAAAELETHSEHQEVAKLAWQ